MSMTCLPFALPRHSSSASAKVAPFGWMTKSTWQVVPPAGGRGLARLDVVDRDRAPEGHVEVRVRVDTAREQVLPDASITRSAWTSSDSPIREIRSPST
jgi:hypothetical protein